MPKLTQAAKVGIFLVLSAVLVFIVYRTVSKSYGPGGGYVVHAFLRDATGLATHSRVTIAGIPVGTIDRIKLEGDRARMNVKVNNDVALFDNATIGKRSALVLGESVLVLTAGTEDRKRLRDGDEIKIVVEFTEPGDVLAEVKEIADRVKDVATQLANAVGTEQGGSNMKAILQNLADATDAMNQTIRENRTYVNETLRNVSEITANGQSQVPKILENIREITEDVRILVAANQQGKGEGTCARRCRT